MRVANEAALDGHVTFGRDFNVARLVECLLRERDGFHVLHSWRFLLIWIALKQFKLNAHLSVQVADANENN